VNWLRRQLTEIREGGRILASRDFRRTFAHYWSGPEISRRMDDWASHLREQTGQPPDPKLEARRKARQQSDQEETQ
jgi:hypothetical protein